MKINSLFFIVGITAMTATPLVAMEKKRCFNPEKYSKGTAEDVAEFLEDLSSCDSVGWAAVTLSMSLKREKPFTQGVAGGWTPLHWAVHKDYTNATKAVVNGVLIAQKSEIGQHNVYELLRHPTTVTKDTALHFAARGKNLKIAARILKVAPTRKHACYLIMVKNIDGLSPLDLAVNENMQALFNKYLDETVSDDQLKVFVKSLKLLALAMDGNNCQVVSPGMRGS